MRISSWDNTLSRTSRRVAKQDAIDKNLPPKNQPPHRHTPVKRSDPMASEGTEHQMTGAVATSMGVGLPDPASKACVGHTHFRPRDNDAGENRGIPTSRSAYGGWYKGEYGTSLKAKPFEVADYKAPDTRLPTANDAIGMQWGKQAPAQGPFGRQNVRIVNSKRVIVHDTLSL